MDKGINLSRLTAGTKLCFCPLILPEGMQLANEKSPSRFQRTEGFLVYEGEIRYVLQYEDTDDQVGRVICAGPGLSEICCAERNVLEF